MPIPVLYDLPSRAPLECWSLNPWKSRLALNYKKIDYETQWVEYPDLAPLFKSLNIPPNDPKDLDYFTDYTSPCMRFDDATYIMESKAIAAELEKRYPDPPLHPERPVVAEAQAKVKVCLGVLYPILLPAGSRNLLNPRSEEFFEVDRKRRFGASLADIEKTQGGERVWEKVKEPAAALAEIFKREKGPFVEGEQVSYVDFVVVGMIHMIKRVDQKYFDRFVALDPVFAELYDSSSEWLVRGDH